MSRVEKRNAIIDIDHLYKRFGSVTALDGLSLEVSDGIFGLIGPNGAGKTTLLKILLGLLKPDGGRAKVLGHDVSRESIQIRKRIGVLHEKAYFPVSMSPTSYLRVVNRVYNSTTSIDEILSLVGLEHAAERKIGQLSAGMHRRLGLAQALCGNPELVFLDEPTIHLDAGGRDDVVSLLARVHREAGVSFFIASHILSELERSCHTVAFVRAGKVVDSGTVSELVTRYTKDRYLIIASDSSRLSKLLRADKRIVDVTIIGTASVVAEVSDEADVAIEELVNTMATPSGITVYRVEPTGTLEDVYRKVNRSE